MRVEATVAATTSFHVLHSGTTFLTDMAQEYMSAKQLSVSSTSMAIMLGAPNAMPVRARTGFSNMPMVAAMHMAPIA